MEETAKTRTHRYSFILLPLPSFPQNLSGTSFRFKTTVTANWNWKQSPEPFILAN